MHAGGRGFSRPNCPVPCNFQADDFVPHHWGPLATQGQRQALFFLKTFENLTTNNAWSAAVPTGGQPTACFQRAQIFRPLCWTPAPTWTPGWNWALRDRSKGLENGGWLTGSPGDGFPFSFSDTLLTEEPPWANFGAPSDVERRPFCPPCTGAGGGWTGAPFGPPRHWRAGVGTG